MSFISWITTVIKTMWPLLIDLWTDWGIHFLFTASLVCQIFLTILGIRRKYMQSKSARFIVWVTYLLLSYVVKITLGKLTVIPILNPENPRYNVELEGLLAPLLLMQLGLPDGITAYAVEDNKLGMRQILNIGATVVFVVRILRRCWDGSSPISKLYFPLFIAGFMKSALWVWALKSVYDENSVVNAEHIPKDTKDVSKLETFPDDAKFASAKDILKAYFRFDCLKPHLMDWPYHPEFISREWMSIDSYTAARAFTVNEIELNFMFDVLYTKAPILYTSYGLIGRFIGFFCLVSALIRFAVIFKNVFLIDMYITYTYALLMAVTSLELYQIVTWAFSDWAVAVMGMNLNVPLVRRILPFLADRCIKKKRWSRSIRKLNLFQQYAPNKKRPKPVRLVLDWFGKWKRVRVVLDWIGKREIFSWRWSHTSQLMPPYLRAVLLRKMAELEVKRHSQPFKERGKWTLEIYGIQEKQGLSRSIKAKIAKSIIIWHIATLILQSDDTENSDAREGSKLLSEYMVYLLALHPHILSLPTSNITLEQACFKLRPFFKSSQELKSVCEALMRQDVTEASLEGGDITTHKDQGTLKEMSQHLRRKWHMLSEVQELVVDLRTMDNKWEFISSIWVEMLCYAAYNCEKSHHAKRLRVGGELITHVWLLLAHRTDKFPYENPEFCRRLPETSLLGRRFFWWLPEDFREDRAK